MLVNISHISIWTHETKKNKQKCNKYQNRDVWLILAAKNGTNNVTYARKSVIFHCFNGISDICHQNLLCIKAKKINYHIKKFVYLFGISG